MTNDWKSKTYHVVRTQPVWKLNIKNRLNSERWTKKADHIDLFNKEKVDETLKKRIMVVHFFCEQRYF